MTGYGEKIKKAVIDQAEKKILAVRNEVAKRLILIAIDRSPVWSGTYVNAHTFEINGVPLTRPFIYPESDYYPDPDARPPYAEQARRQLIAMQRAESILTIETETSCGSPTTPEAVTVHCLLSRTVTV